MAMYACVCSKCGGQITVDSSREHGYCPFCGTEYITSIVINNSNQYYLDTEYDRLVDAATNAMQHNDYPSATGYYKQIIDRYPHKDSQNFYNYLKALTNGFDINYQPCFCESSILCGPSIDDDTIKKVRIYLSSSFPRQMAEIDEYMRQNNQRIQEAQQIFEKKQKEQKAREAAREEQRKREKDEAWERYHEYEKRSKSLQQKRSKIVDSSGMRFIVFYFALLVGSIVLAFVINFKTAVIIFFSLLFVPIIINTIILSHLDRQIRALEKEKVYPPYDEY